MRRYWINAPSTLQPNHKFHGMEFIGPDILEEIQVKIYPNSGSIYSMVIPPYSFSDDWPSVGNIKKVGT